MATSLSPLEPNGRSMRTKVRILGPLEVVIDGAVCPLAGGRRRALVTRLAIARGTSVPTEQLVDDLWHGEPPDKAIRTLRTYVSKVRVLLGPDVLVTRTGGYALEVPSDTLDADRFERVALSFRPSADHGARVDALRGALALWRGPALGELASEPWGKPEAARLEQMRLATTEELLELEIELGRHTKVLPELERLTGQHRYQERLWALLALARHRNGQRTDALRAIKRARDHLVDAGLDLGAELQTLEHRILDQDPALLSEAPNNTIPPGHAAGGPSGSPRGEGGAAPVPPGLLRWVPLPGSFVGREKEVVDVVDRLCSAEASMASAMVVVEGEPGVGKTRLAVEAVCRLSERGCLVLAGRCDELHAQPYQPFREAIVDFASAVAGDQVASDPDWLAIVTDGQRAGAALHHAGGGDDADRRHLFDAVDRWLRSLGAERPVVLVIDDLQWADPLTLLLLRHLLRSRRGRLAVLATRRRSRYEPTTAACHTLGELRRWAAVRRVDLVGLSEDGVVELLASRLRRPPSQAEQVVIRQVCADTSGNPFFALEVINHLLENGTLGDGSDVPPVAEHGPTDKSGDGHGRHRPTVSTGQAGDLPSAVLDMVACRLSKLPETARRVVTMAAVAGPVFDATILARALELDETTFVGALEQATAAHFVHPTSDDGQDVPTGDAYQFSHTIVRQALYDSIAPRRRARAHRDLLRVLETASDADNAATLTHIGAHVGKAAGIGSWDESSHHVELAGHHPAGRPASPRAEPARARRGGAPGAAAG